MEGCNINLLLDSQIPHWVRSGGGTKRSSSGTWMLHCHIGDGWSFTNNVIKEQRTVAEPMEGSKEVLLDNSRPERTTRIGTLAHPPVRQVLIAFLRENWMSSPRAMKTWLKLIIWLLSISWMYRPLFLSSIRRNWYSRKSETRPYRKRFTSYKSTCAWISRTWRRHVLRTATHFYKSTSWWIQQRDTSCWALWMHFLVTTRSS